MLLHKLFGGSKVSKRLYTVCGLYQTVLRVLVKCDEAFKAVMFLTLQVSSLLGLCGRMKAALQSGPPHESAACVKSKQLVRTTK